ncbi:MAG: chromosomal replication initiator protein, partial [Candidatus Berkelbacteria bacterium Athens1014_28]
MDNLEKIWQAVLAELEVEISKPNFKTWFKNTFICDFKKGVFTVGVPNIFFEGFLKKKYLSEIKKALQKQTNEPVSDVKFKVAESSNLEKKDDEKNRVIHSPVDNSVSYSHVDNPVDNFSEKVKHRGLKEQYDFESFIVGTSNQLAQAAAKSVAEKPGKAYNPLYIYGDSGLGKTHLLQAIGNRILEKSPNSKIRYTSCEAFTNDYIESVKIGKAKEFKDRYRNIDILLIDDIQFLSKKELTQEEFFNTFDHLHQKNKQVVMTSDRTPKDIKGLEKRLQTRFEWGMVADIQPPDFETRCAILKTKCEEQKKEISNDIIEFIAKNITSNIRELEGALIKLFAVSELTAIELSIAEAERILGESLHKNQLRQVISVEKIIKAVQ